LEGRAAVHAALGEQVRLAIVDELAVSDRSAGALAARLGVGSNLLAHHVDVLERAGLVERVVSSGDRRRRYVRLRRRALADAGVAVGPATVALPRGRALFVCTHNSARSQLAAALWRRRTGAGAASAGTHPAERVHPGAVAAAARAGLDLGSARPRVLAEGDLDAEVVVTVCDRAHEELAPGGEWLHWSTPDPVGAGPEAFDEALAELDDRITTLAGDPTRPTAGPTGPTARRTTGPTARPTARPSGPEEH
jgi:protein-tyrosine-phosphatase